MMRRLALALMVSLLGMGVAWADGDTNVVDATTVARHTRTVFNNASSALTSGTVVIWDTGSTSFTASGYPYVNTTTTADVVSVAGVIIDGSCAASSLCQIVDQGPVLTRCANSTDPATINLTVGTSTVAGQCGDYTPAADAGVLGWALQSRSGVADNQNIMVFVDIQHTS